MDQRAHCRRPKHSVTPAGYPVNFASLPRFAGPVCRPTDPLSGGQNPHTSRNQVGLALSLPPGLNPLHPSPSIPGYPSFCSSFLSAAPLQSAVQQRPALSTLYILRYATAKSARTSNGQQLAALWRWNHSSVPLPPGRPTLPEPREPLAVKLVNAFYVSRAALSTV